MVSIDPRTMAVRAGGGGIAGNVVRLVGFTVAVGVLVHGWQGLLAPPGDADADADADSDSYICIESAHGCGPIAVEISDEDRFDDEQANAPDDEALGDVALAPNDLDESGPLPSGGLVDDVLGDEPGVPAPRAAETTLAVAPGTLSCIVSDLRGACLNWEDLPPADRALLQDLYRRNGVKLP